MLSIELQCVFNGEFRWNLISSHLAQRGPPSAQGYPDLALEEPEDLHDMTYDSGSEERM